MLRISWILCMAWLIILNSMVYSVICVNFQLNRSFISEMFCENKYVPMSECNGQCYLNKQLNEATNQQDSDWMDLRADFHIYTLCENVLFRLKAEHPSRILHNSNEQSFFLQDYFFAQDKPPQLL